MAGIGFKLQELFSKDLLSKRLKAYLYSTIVAAGPWLITITTVNLFLLLAKHYFQHPGQKDLFMGTIVYSFIFSQIFTAPWHLLVTRYVSDRLYEENYTRVWASLMGISKLILVFGWGVGLTYYLPTKLPLYYQLLATALFIFIALIWIIMLYLVAVKNYSVIVISYLLGGGTALAAGFFLMHWPLGWTRLGEAGNLLAAFLLGIIITYTSLLYSFLSSFPAGEEEPEFEFIGYCFDFPSLILISLFYTCGLWVDDILMWYSKVGINIYDVYRFAPVYDNAVFLGYLTTIPSMMLFMVRIETNFYKYYKCYYRLIVNNAVYDQIKQAKDKMVSSLFKQLTYTMETQAVITLMVIIFSENLLSWLQIPGAVNRIFVICVLGAFCNIFVLFIFLILLYFEARKFALFSAASFLVTNFGLTLYFIPQGESFYGLGYFLGSLITLLLSVFLLRYFLRWITYYTFVNQPLFKKRSGSEQDGFLANLGTKQKKPPK